MNSRWHGSVATVGLAGVVLGAAALGAEQARHGGRVLAVLDPIVSWLATAGGALTAAVLAHLPAAAVSTVAVALLIAALGLAAGGRQARPLLLLAAAVAGVVCGQVSLLGDRVAVGILLYAAGILAAAALGVRCPLAGLPGTPRWPRPGEPSAGTATARWPAWEMAVVCGLTLLATLTRLYALTELPDAFDSETSLAALSSGTWDGLRHYLPWGLTGSSIGIGQLFAQLAVFEILGTSVYAIRLVAALCGVLTVPLCYWLARRVAGAGPAGVAALLLVAAPEQLFWSRSENTHFAPIALLAVVTAHLGVWMVHRLAAAAVLAAALWMPVGRFFYLPAAALMAYPLAVYAHAVLCVRGAWRSVWYAVPLLAGGVLLWVYAVSIVLAPLNDWEWRYVNPSGVFAKLALQPERHDLEAGAGAALRHRAATVAGHAGQVVTALAYRTGFSHFYVRLDPSEHPTLMNAGVLILIVLGIGYLLGQLRDRRAFALLMWAGLGVVPALLSDIPADRRMSITFPALYVIAGVFAGAAVRIVRVGAGPWLARVTATALGIAIAGVAWSSAASFFRLPIRPLPADGAFRFTRPLFEDSDIIFHNFDPEIGAHILFGNLDAFVRRPVCYRALDAADWRTAALRPRCTFTEDLYRFALAQPRISALQAAPPGERVTYLMNDHAEVRPPIAMLRALHPDAPYGEFRSRTPEIQLGALTVDAADRARLRTLRLRTRSDQPADDLAAHLLAGVTLVAEQDDSVVGLVVSGGVLIEQPGWYRFGVDPPCTQASLSIDGAPAAEQRPLLAGVHPIELGLPDAGACAGPLRVVVESNIEPEEAPLSPEAMVAPDVAALPGVRAARVEAYPGYGAAHELARPTGYIVDFGVDPGGTVFVLAGEPGGYRVHRFDVSGTEEAVWEPAGVRTARIEAIAPTADGRVLLRGERTVWAFDGDGRPLAEWGNERAGSPELAVLPDGRTLNCRIDRNAVVIASRDGQTQTEWTTFAGGPERFRDPATVVANPRGELLVIEAGGQALLFDAAVESRAPRFVRSFTMSLRGAPLVPRGVTFGADGHIVIPEIDGNTLVYRRDGQRLMAAEQGRDLSSRGFGHAVRYQAVPGRLYVLDEARRLWRLAAGG